jgi:hypothetical protein
MNRLGRTLCLLSLGALVLPACIDVGHVGGATLDCAQPAAAWISRLRESWSPKYGDAVVTESGYVAVILRDSGAYFVALAFETLQGEDGIDVEDPVAIFGTDSPPTSGDVGYVWATQGWAEALGLIEPAGRQQQDEFAAQQAIECVPHFKTLVRAGQHNDVAPSHILLYRVDSNTHRGDITYANEFGRETHRKDTHLPWEYHVAAADGYVAKVSAMRYGASGYIRCTIELDGAVVRSNASTGKYSICTATETV